MKKYLYEMINTKTNNENSIVLANMDKIASEAGITHKSMNRLINNNKKHLMQSGSVRFENEAGSSHKKIYKLNSAQCAYIIEKMHANGANDLKKQIANVFAYQIRKQLERQAVHQISKSTTKSFYEAIQYYLDDPAGYMYGHITNLAYKLALGVGVRKIQTSRGAHGTSNKKNYLYPDEIELLSKAMNKIEMLLELGYKYYDIKNYVDGKYLSKIKLNSTIKEKSLN